MIIPYLTHFVILFHFFNFFLAYWQIQNIFNPGFQSHFSPICKFHFLQIALNA